MKFTAACLQLTSGDDMGVNIRMIENMLREAAAHGAQFIFMPENAFLMQEPGKPFPINRMESQALRLCSDLAKTLQVWILIGSLQAPSPDESRCFNRSILIDDRGMVFAAYDKIHLFDAMLSTDESYRESDRMVPGNRLVLAQTPWGKLGMSVCYDLRFAQLFRALAKAGADFLAVPAAFTYTTGRAHWHVLLRARAIETGCYVFAPAQCAMHPGNRRTYGHSLIVGPWGEILAEASEDIPGIIYADIDTAKVADARTMIPSLQHDRDFSEY